MKYFSEDTVRKIINDTVNALLHVRKPQSEYSFIEIQEPHGRLIDADVLKATLRIGLANASAFLKGQYKELADKLTDDICLDIDDAPTVIESSIERQVRRENDTDKQGN